MACFFPYPSSANSGLAGRFSQAVCLVPPSEMTLYTVEQLELIRRLKQTGISVEAVVEAFHEMGSVSSELDTLNEARQAVLAASLLSPRFIPSSTPSESASLPLPPLLPVSLSSPVNPVFLALQAQAPVPVTISSSPSIGPSPSMVPLATSASSTPTATSPPSTTQECQPRSRSQRTPMREITTLDDPAELDEFMKNGEESCISDMKAFITHYSLRQTTVAMMTGVSQPYISKLLNGNHRELSLRCRKNIYSWYLNCRRHPEKLATFLNDPSSRLETNGDGELVPQKRERYVFRPCLIRLLEQFFAETPFPDSSRRIEIATACNHALQVEKKGVGLMPKEVVSPQVVSNWFANKRKELRRRNHDRSDGGMGGNSAIVEALEGEVSSEAGSSPMREDNTSPSESSQSNRPALPPPDFTILEALGLNLFNGAVKAEP